MSSQSQVLKAILVGNSGDDFICQAEELCAQYELECIVCGDIYSAVGHLARSSQNNVLVVGQLERLVMEKGGFLQRIARNRFICCCFSNAKLGKNNKKALTAKEMGAFIIEEPAELEEIVGKLLSDGTILPAEKRPAGKASGFNKDQFVTTKAEIEALLGV